jgi:protein-L-isoaspartate(D-aspartate) O-methyltransferase
MKPLTEEHLAIFRRQMVEVIDIEFDLLSDEIGRDRLGDATREAFLNVPRHLFVPQQLAAFSYQNQPLPIGFDKTISQPFIAALMIELLDIRSGDRALEIGTGLGYQAAILAELAEQVWSVEIVEEFAAIAAPQLRDLGYDNVVVRVGDGSRGWPEQAPFDIILVTAAAKQLPPALLAQLAAGGRMVLPLVENEVQQLVRVEKLANGELRTQTIMPVRFTELETVF